MAPAPTEEIDTSTPNSTPDNTVSRAVRIAENSVTCARANAKTGLRKISSPAAILAAEVRWALDVQRMAEMRMCRPSNVSSWSARLRPTDGNDSYQTLRPRSCRGDCHGTDN